MSRNVAYCKWLTGAVAPWRQGRKRPITHEYIWIHMNVMLPSFRKMMEANFVVFFENREACPGAYGKLSSLEAVLKGAHHI